MAEGMGYEDVNWFELVMPKVQEDTAQALQMQSGRSTINKPLLDQIGAYWGAAPEEREGMEPPSFAGVFGPGMEDSMVGTIGTAASQWGDQKGFMDWLEANKVDAVAAYQDPMQKNRAANLLVQSGLAGQEKKMMGMLQPGEAAPAPPTAPGPVSAGQGRGGQLGALVDPTTGLNRQEIIEYMNQGALSREEASAALARLDSAAQQ
jgi:hypothetical protein